MLEVIAEIEVLGDLGFAHMRPHLRVGFQECEKIAFAAPDLHGVLLHQPVGLLARHALLGERDQQPLRVHEPAEAIERIHAAGDARAESTARDSLNTPDTPALARTDWMEGDTIVASFARVDTLAAPDPAAESADEYRLERLTAIGSARSLYRLPAEDSTLACGDLPAIHYVTGERIVIISGTSIGKPGGTNLIKLQEVE